MVAATALVFDSEAHVVLSLNCSVVFASPLGAAWTKRETFWAKVVSWVRSLAFTGEQASSIALAEASVRAVRMRGAGGVRYLLTISSRERPPGPQDQLTPAQREVAHLAAVGATIPEIARHLERSPETVRSHMREIYRRLHIASRVELVLALRSPQPT